MPVAPNVFIQHPVTKEMHTVKEAGIMIGISTASVYQRIRKGDTGERLWRISGQYDLAPRDTKAEQKRRNDLLQAIPSTTSYEDKLWR